jgi:hypothetical protein
MYNPDDEAAEKSHIRNWSAVRANAPESHGSVKVPYVDAQAGLRP